MCDTIGKIINKEYAIFGKNSDRAVNEPQVVEFYQAQDYKEDETLKCTYISIPQARHTNAIVLSRPVWLWGGEIGVNEYGVCIGNEAVFTKGKYGQDSLIGMDLLRLGLERGNSAIEAMNVIIDLLEEYGQGGNCGYDSDFHYDNSFLIMDRKDIFVLETKDKEYVYKRYDHISISNCLSIEEDGDIYSGNRINFKKTYSDFIMTTGSQGNRRRSQSSSHRLDGLKDMMDILRSHDTDDVFTKGSVSSVCMHGSNSLTADGTTMSMIVELKDDITIWLTGSSCPCVSLYKPHKFEAGKLIQVPNEKPSYWYEMETRNRLFLNHVITKEFKDKLEEYQDKIIDDPGRSLDIETEFLKYKMKLPYKKGSLIYNSFWNKKNAIFMKEK